MSGSLNTPITGKRFHPTLIIGVGGAGTMVIERVHGRVHEAFGKLPELMRPFQFLAFDTQKRGQAERPMPPECYFELGGLDGRRFTRVLSREDHRFRDLLPPLNRSEQPYPSRSMDRGAGANRIDGFIAFLANQEVIRSAVCRARDRAVDILDSRTVEKPSISVYVVNSLSGGTGSGMFINLAYLLRGLLEGYRVKIYGVALTPGVVDLFAGDLERDRRIANAFASLLEVDFYSNQLRGVPYSLCAGDSHVIDGENRPFDLVYLMDTTNRQGRHVNSYNVIINSVADMLYVLSAQQASDDVHAPSTTCTLTGLTVASTTSSPGNSNRESTEAAPWAPSAFPLRALPATWQPTSSTGSGPSSGRSLTTSAIRHRPVSTPS